MSKTALTMVLIGTVSAILLIEVSAAGSEIRPFAELCLDAQFSMPPVKKVSNVPESIRDVPMHPDDSWGTPGVIAADSADSAWLTEIRFLKLGLRADLSESVTWENFADLSFNYGHYAKLGGDLRRRNYTNAPGTEQRGYGAALTFWTPGYDALIPGFRSELHFKSWFLGFGLRPYSCGIITGYDRYDSVAENEDYVRIGELLETSLCIGWSKRSANRRWVGNFRVGVNFNQFSEKEQYRDIDVDVSTVTPFVGAAIGWRF